MTWLVLTKKCLFTQCNSGQTLFILLEEKEKHDTELHICLPPFFKVNGGQLVVKVAKLVLIQTDTQIIKSVSDFL